LSKLEEVFADRSSAEDAKKALYNCKQGNQPLDVFNSLFSSLVFAVDLTEESRIDVYKASLNPKILEIAIQKDSWKSAKTLRAKMDLAILASNILDELTMLRSNMSVRRPDFQLQRPPPPPPPPRQPLPTDTPMDIDAITASTGFTFSVYRALCVKNKLCQRCHKAYDEAHISNRSCPNTEVPMKDKLDLFSRLSRNEPPTTQLTQINLVPTVPQPNTGSWDHIGPGSFADMLMYGVDEEGNPFETDGKLFPSICSVSPHTSPSLPKIPSSPSRLVLPIHILRPGSSPLVAMALIDSGAGDSFINTDFVRLKCLGLTNLITPFSCRSFDGSPASSGDVTECWRGRIALSDFLNHSSISFVSLNVVSLSSVDVILGLPWLKANRAWVGGSDGQLYFESSSFASSSLPISSQSLNISSITNNIHLSSEEILSLPSKLRSFSDVFTVASLQSLPPVRPQFDLKIQLKQGCVPPFGGLYNLSEAERRQLRLYIDDNLSKGFLRLSSSPAAAPIFFVKSEGKDDRPCVDYRGLNAITIRDSYPIPVLSLLLNNLAGCKFLSKVDLKSAFNLLRVTPGQEYLTAFRTPWGLFEYMVMPFGLANAPATFQRFIQHVLREFIDVCCFVYIDDILIFSKTEEEHFTHLSSILAKLREFSLKASLKKCQFFQTEVQFLGFIISSQGLRMDPAKLDTIVQWPLPETLRGLRRFLGFCNFYRRFIPNFSTVAGPLTNLTKEAEFRPSRLKEIVATNAFSTLKSSFLSAPLLSHFSFDSDRIVHVDSSGFAIAGVLSQPDSTGRLRPVSFFSRKLTDQERVWPIFDLELYAVISAFEEWRAWLAGTKNPVLVYSDHANLKHFMTAKVLSPKQARWAAFLDSFNFKLFHVAGPANPADGPSRRPDFDVPSKNSFSNSFVPHFQLNSIESQIHAKQEHDLYFQPLSSEFISLLKTSYDSLSADEKEDYHLDQDLYWFRHRVFVPLELRERVITTYHNDTLVGHPGMARTLSLLLRTFDWPTIRKDVISFVSSCDSCQRVRFSRQNPVGTLQPLPIPTRPWSVIGMDFITKLPLSQGYDSILVVVDLLSKSAHFVPTRETITAKDLATLFRREVFRLHGLPDRIISDRGTTMTSEFWQQLMKLLNIKSAMSTAFHPQTDGQTERMNQVLEDYLRHFVDYNQKDWSSKLDVAEFSINNLHSTSSGVSPFFFVHGYHPRFNTLTVASRRNCANRLISDLQEIQGKASLSLQKAKEKQAFYYNQSRRVATVFAPGDQVLLSRRNIQTRRPNSKLDFRHLGPFKVVEMVGENAARLDIAEHYPKIHPVFNVSLLTAYKDPSAHPLRSLPFQSDIHSVPIEQINWDLFEEVLDHRTPYKGTEEYLLRWKCSTPAHNRWIPLSLIPRALHHHLISFHTNNRSAIPLLLTGIR
jgi:transposase InsO family protein